MNGMNTDHKQQIPLGFNFFLLWQGQIVSQIGTHLFNIARVFFLTQVLNSGTLVGALLASCVVATLIVSPFAGVYVDRKSRRNTMILSDLFSGIVSVFLGLLAFWSNNHWLLVFALFVSSISISISNSFFSPAVFALIPKLVPEERLRTANSLFSSTYQIAQIIGQGVGGILYGVVGAPVLFICNGISFIVSGFSEMFITKDPSPAILPSATLNVSKKTPIRKEILDALQYIVKQPGMRESLVFQTCMNIAFVPLFVLVPFFAERHLQGGPYTYGYLIASLSLGMLFGMTASAKIRPKTRLRSIVLAVSFFLLPFSFGSISLIEAIIFLLFAFFCIGFAVGVLGPLITTAIQKNTNDLHRGKVSALMTTISNIFGPLAFVLAGIAVDISSSHFYLIFVALGVFIGIVLLLISLFRPCFFQFLNEN